MLELRIPLALFSAFTAVYVLCFYASASIKSKTKAFLFAVGLVIFLPIIPTLLVTGLGPAGNNLIYGSAADFLKGIIGILVGVAGLAGIFYFPLAGYRKLSIAIYIVTVAGFSLVFWSMRWMS